MEVHNWGFVGRSSSYIHKCKDAVVCIRGCFFLCGFLSVDLVFLLLVRNIFSFLCCFHVFLIGFLNFLDWKCITEASR